MNDSENRSGNGSEDLLPSGYGEQGGDDRTEPKVVLEKWLSRLRRQLDPAGDSSDLNGERSEKPHRREKPFSLKVAAILNLLNIPLFWAGILFFIWLLLDLAFRYTLPPSNYAEFARLSAPWAAVAGPAVVGYWTNWLAIKMLFHPRRKNAVWWGLLPARRTDLLESLSQGVLDQLISPEIVRDYLKTNRFLQKFLKRLGQEVRGITAEEEFRSEAKALIHHLISGLINNPATLRAIRDFLTERISAWNGQSLGGKMIEWTKNIWSPLVVEEVMKALPEIPKTVTARLDELLDRLPRFIEAKEEKIEAAVTGIIVEGLRSLDMRGIIKAQLNKMNEREIEELLTGNVADELVFIQTFGGIFGSLVGLAIIFPLLRPWFIITGIGLWAVYVITVEK